MNGLHMVKYCKFTTKYEGGISWRPLQTRPIKPQPYPARLPHPLLMRTQMVGAGLWKPSKL